MFSAYYYNNPAIKHIMSAINELWWRWMPGVTFKVKWPVGEVRIKQEQSGIWDYVRSADPNDHYRPELERLVGRQGWDWDWELADNDIAANHLTIKIRRSKAQYAPHFILLWS